MAKASIWMVAILLAGCADGGPAGTSAGAGTATDRSDRVIKSDEEWQATLSREAFKVLRRRGTERAFSGAYWDHHEPGIYQCAGCGLPLFSSAHKFDSGTGWPSFFEQVAPGAVATEEDRSLLLRRIEVHCSRCGGHLGHLFDDGPPPTGQRYCVNSVALAFTPASPLADGR